MLKLRICQVNLHLFLSIATGRNADDLLGGCGQAFSAVIVSPLFEKKTTLARHRLVNSELKSEIAAIHAWTPKCYTPEQWEKQKADGNQAVAPGKDTTREVVTGTTA
jgi:stress-induced morphogen